MPGNLEILYFILYATKIADKVEASLFIKLKDIMVSQVFFYIVSTPFDDIGSTKSQIYHHKP